jgi:ankyrin repeat protein
MSDDNKSKPENPGNKQDEDAIAFMQGLFELARNGGTGPLNVMLEAGVPLNIRTSEGDTLLMLACRNGHADTARLLLERGADADASNHQGQTPLMAAAMSDRVDLVESLLDAGADPSLKNADGHIAAEVANSTGAEGAAKRLA